MKKKKYLNMTLHMNFIWCVSNFLIAFAAKVACVKSRDMHWALVAHRDQRDINLSSLRMLIVADGANPCKLCCFPLAFKASIFSHLS